MRKEMRLKVNAMDIFVWKIRGLGPFELFMVIMKDMKLHILSHSQVIISVVMDAAGNHGSFF